MNHQLIIHCTANLLSIATYVSLPWGSMAISGRQDLQKLSFLPTMLRQLVTCPGRPQLPISKTLQRTQIEYSSSKSAKFSSVIMSGRYGIVMVGSAFV